ncbi:MAG: hypothetical protein BGO49_27160 [Planctomycetales bacterium 71-10]|nr:MAG: hypothetical protein BGO49_27160 [Planctomycetales bacterium 71-10]
MAVIYIDPQKCTELIGLAMSSPDPKVRSVCMWAFDLVRTVVQANIAEMNAPPAPPPRPTPAPVGPQKPRAISSWWPGSIV